jgi:peptidyl-prolyl cis-trans isomerase A (cyclophilin A)
MTQVKRGNGRVVVGRKQQRFSLLTIAGSLALIGGFVALLLQNDPFPGVRQAAMRHRRQSEVENPVAGGDVQRDFRTPELEKEETKEGDGSQQVEGGQEAAIVDPAAAAAVPETGEIVVKEADLGRIYTFELASLKDGKKGNVVVQTRPEWAPIGVEHFHELMDNEFYNDAKIFRVVNNFMVQFGISAIPKSEEMTPIKDDPVIKSNARGTITYAMAGPNTRTSQLFINTRQGGNAFLDNQGFSPFGEIIEGMDIVDQIYSGYGEKPNQGKIQNRGNEYLDKEFPLLSYVSKAYEGNPRDEAAGGR